MKTRLVVAVVLTVGMLSGVLSAQGPDSQGMPNGEDPPSRVARLSGIEGQVSFQPASIDTWTAATLNYPLTTGDHVYTDAGSRAEMRIGRNSIRLNAQTNFGFLNLDDRTVQIRFTSGAMEARVRLLEDQDVYEVDTPNGAVSLLRNGDYRIDSDPDRNATMVTVFSGEVEVTSNGQSFSVHPRQTAWFAEGAAPDIRQQNPPDDFDRFTADGNRREESVPPTRHVHPDMIGGEDLDAYGTWREEADYGWVWAPPVQAGWAPYRTGRWAWVEPWGWTWIDEAPWGFAPFHYGRWAMGGRGWFWIPGAVAIRPVYAPALVAFVGGPRFSIGVGIGGGGGIGAVAWFPLGPREVYRPVYAVSPAYVRNVNIMHVTNVTNITNVNVTNVRYVNQNVQGAATAVPQNSFAGGRSVSREAIQVTPQQMANAQISHTAMVSPQRESVFAGGRIGAGVAQPSQSMMRQQVVAKTTPPPAPVSFQAKQAALNQNGGRPLAPEQVTQLRQQQPAAVVNQAPVRSATNPGQGRTFQNTNGFGSGRPAIAAPPQTTTAPQPPVNRLDSQPPTAAQPGASQPTGQPTRPQFNRPDVNRPQQTQQPSQPQQTQEPTQPRFGRPAQAPTPESRPETTVRPATPQSAAPGRPANPGRPPAEGRGRRADQDKDKKEERR